MDNFELDPRADLLIESMRSIGYTFESAMADIIDNSISAKASNIDIKFNPKTCELAFIDDGFGMSFTELKEAMRWGSTDPLVHRNENDLGRFGLGLKSASLSQCRKLTVISKKDNKIHGLCWDLDYVRQTGKWLVSSVDNIDVLPYMELLKANKSGTYVLWSDFDKIEVTSKNVLETMEEMLNYAADYLELIFHIFIKEGLNIKINNNKLKFFDPYLTNNLCTQILKLEKIYIKDNNGFSHPINIQPYVLPHFNSLSPTEKQLLEKNNGFRNKQGFYIYRNKRLIIWGTWFRIIKNNELFKNARIRVDIPNSLDDIWSIDVKKSSASIPASIKKQLYYFVKSSIHTSKRVYTKRAINISKDMGYECVWDKIEEDNKISYKINRNLPLIENLSLNLNEEQNKLLNLILEDIENNLPKYEIYNQIASNNDNLNEDTLESVKQRIFELLNIIKPKSNQEFENIINSLLQSEPYCKYENLYNEIKKGWHI